MSTKYLVDAPKEDVRKVVFSTGVGGPFTYPAVSVEIDNDNDLVIRDIEGDLSGLIQAEDVDRLVEAISILKANINQ